MNSTAAGSKSASSFARFSAAARDSAGSTGVVISGAGLADSGRNFFNSASKRIQRPGQLLQRGLGLGGGATVADDFLQRAGGGLHLLGAEIRGHALDRVGDALRKRGVAAGKRGGDLRDGGSLLLGELAEEFQIELAVACDAGEAVLGVEAGDGGKCFRI